MADVNVKRLLKGKNPQQQKVIKYFLENGCIASLTRMKDDEYDAMVMGTLNKLDLQKRALNKIGLDEDQVKENAPVFFHGYEFDDKTFSRVGSDDRLRSSKYSGTWLFFSVDQVYMYSYMFDMTSDSKKESTEEYFYRDITNFSTVSESIEVSKTSGCSSTVNRTTRDYHRFGLIVPGDKFYCSTTGVADADSSITAMKNQLRAKKTEK